MRARAHACVCVCHSQFDPVVDEMCMSSKGVDRKAMAFPTILVVMVTKGVKRR